ncbi:WD40 repeat domain-containing protein [Lentzea sp. E54]|uniref:WD40 repeat domain-containing protein n=1 Tax=Lentzea xerophila TaxID=3435883 RepID=UPI003DA56A4A
MTVEGRTVLVLPASGRDSGLVRAVDLDTGTVLPDRSLLRYERHEVLALGAGRLLATLGPQRKTVVVRDAVTGSPVGVPIREEQQTRSLTLAMAGGRPVVITTGSGLAIWDVETGALVGRHARLRGRHLVTFQGRLLLVAEESARSLRLYDVLTGEPFGHPLPCDFCMSVYRLSAVEHDGRLLVAFLDSHADTKVSLWDVTAGVELPTVPPGDDVRGISLALVDGRPLLLVGRSGKSGSLMLWDPIAGREVLPDCFAGYGGDWAGLELSSLDDGFFAVTVSGSAADLWVWSAEGMRRTSLVGGGVWRTATGMVDGRPTVAIGGSDGDLRLFDVRTGQEFGSPFYGGPVGRVIGGTDDAGRALVLLSGRPMRWWDVAAGVPVARLDRSTGGITGFATGELDGRMVVALLADRGGLSVWDPAAGAPVAEISLEPAGDLQPETVAFTEIGGRTAVAAAIGRAVWFWDAATGEPLGRPYRGLQQTVLQMATGRIGDRPVIAAAGGKDELVHVFDPATGAAVVPPLAGHTGALTALTLGTADGRAVVASGSWDHTVRVWDAATGQCVGGPWSGHGDYIAAVHVTEWNGEPVVVSHAQNGPPRMWRLRAAPADNGHSAAVHSVAAGRWEGRPVFVSGAADRTVRLWDAATGRPLGPALTDHAAAVTHVAFAGDTLLTGDESGVVLRRHAGALRSEPLARLRNGIAGIGTAELDGRIVVGVATRDGVFRCWDAATGRPYAGLHTGADMVRRADIGVLNGRLIALTIAAADDSPVLTLWDVAAGTPLYEPMPVPEECTVGTLAMLDGRLAAIHGIDAGQGYLPEEAADVQVIDIATRTVLARHRQKRGWSQHATVARSVGGTVVLVAAEDWVSVMNPFDTGGSGSEEFAGHNAFVTCVATAAVAGRTVVASGDSGNGLHFWDLDTHERLH